MKCDARHPMGLLMECHEISHAIPWKVPRDHMGLPVGLPMGDFMRYPMDSVKSSMRNPVRSPMAMANRVGHPLGSVGHLIFPIGSDGNKETPMGCSVGSHEKSNKSRGRPCEVP